MIWGRVLKKICYITTVSVTLQSFVIESAKYLHENCGYDISFISAPDEAFEKSLPEYIHFYPVKMNRGINIDGLGAVVEMIRIFKEQDFDMVQYSTPNASCYASVAAWLARIPIRLYCQWGIAYVGFEGIKRKLFKLIEKTVCALSTHVKPDSRGNLEFSVSEGLYKENKGSVIWNGSASGVNLDKFDISKKNEFREIIRKKYNIPSDAFVFGFVGRVTCDKGINELLSSYKMLLEEDERVRLLIVGRTEIDDRIDMALLEWAQNEKRIDFCGYTNEVEKYISAMDCYVLPSYREGFGLGVVEAEAMGVPVVVTDIPGPRDAIINEKTGLAVPKKDTEQLYKAMRYMLCNRQESEMMGHEGYKFASENFEQKKLFQMIADDRTALLMKTSKSNKDKK